MELNATIGLERSYWAMLENLSKDMKLKLISMLSESVRSDSSESTAKGQAKMFYGVWKDDKDADFLADEIRKNRHFRNRDEVLL